MNVLLSVINADVSHSMKHDHACWELVYRLTGNSDTTINNTTYRISKGDFYIVPPFVPHKDFSQEQFSDLVVRLDGVLFTDTLILHDYDGFIQSILQMINYVMSKKDINYTAVANSLADALFQHLSPDSLVPNNFVHKLKNVIFENVGNPNFDLTKEIKNMNYHPDYIRRRFKSETTKTPLSYLVDIRIDRAKQLLVMPSYESIEIISAKCGFRDSFYFSTCFKKHTGLSPLQYRKTNGKK